MKIRELRQQYKYRQVDMAEKLKVSQSTYQGYETGETQPGIDKLMQLADIFNVSLDYLVERPNYSLSQEQQRVIEAVKMMTAGEAKQVETFIEVMKKNR